MKVCSVRQGDTKEGFYICKAVPKSDPQYNPAKLRGPNQWPSPSTLPNFRPLMEQYFQSLSALGLHIVRLLALSLNLPKHYFDSMFDDPMAALRLLHYGPKQSDPQKGIYACGAHSDYGMITILLTDDNPGLQIFTKDKEWVDVPPMKGAFVVNLGDMLERWSNGLYRSTLHRVLTVSRSGKAIPDRYSIPFFYEVGGLGTAISFVFQLDLPALVSPAPSVFFQPNFDSVVDVLETCHNQQNPIKYPPIKSGDYLLSKYSATHADFAPADE